MSLLHVSLENKKELIRLLYENSSMIEDGVEILGESLGTDEFPLIDLLAKDNDGRALIILAQTKPDEDALLHIALQLDWIMMNRRLLTTLYPKLRLSKSAPPRAALIYPEFPQIMKRFVRAALPSQAPLLYQYRCFENHGKRFLYLEKFIPEQAGVKRKEDHAADLPPFRTGVAMDEVEITPEEREAFLS